MRKRYFFDTSALVKLYHHEEWTDTLDRMIEAENPIIVISDIGIVEMVSALLKKTRMNLLDKQTCDNVIAEFEKDIDKFEVIEADTVIKNSAGQLLKDFGTIFGLKTLDALQLASALSASEISKLDLFIVTDRTLGSVARQKGLNVFDL